MPKVALNTKKYAMKALGKYLASHRELQDMTQTDLAEKMGIKQQKVSYMELHPGRITLEDLYELNKALNLDIPQLLKAFGKTTQDIRALAKEYQ